MSTVDETKLNLKLSVSVPRVDMKFRSVKCMFKMKSRRCLHSLSVREKERERKGVREPARDPPDIAAERCLGVGVQQKHISFEILGPLAE